MDRGRLCDLPLPGRSRPSPRRALSPRQRAAGGVDRRARPHGAPARERRLDRRLSHDGPNDPHDARRGDRGAVAVPGVDEVHDLHVWQITSGDVALSAHVLVDPGTDCHALRRDLELAVAGEYGITHTTLQVDHAGAPQARHDRPLLTRWLHLPARPAALRRQPRPGAPRGAAPPLTQRGPARDRSGTRSCSDQAMVVRRVSTMPPTWLTMPSCRIVGCPRGRSRARP